MEAIFKQAVVRQGVDSWRRIVSFIDHGRGTLLELLRKKRRTVQSKMIKNLEGITMGMAEFENTISEYVVAGGAPPSPKEMKSDLNAILPASLCEQLSVRVSDVQYTYQ